MFLTLSWCYNKLRPDRLPGETFHKSVMDFRRRLNACMKADGKHFEHYFDKAKQT